MTTVKVDAIIRFVCADFADVEPDQDWEQADAELQAACELVKAGASEISLSADALDLLVDELERLIENDCHLLLDESGRTRGIRWRASVRRKIRELAE